MCAVCEAALSRMIANLRECVVYPIARTKKTQFAHPWRVDQHGSIIKEGQLATGSSMDTFPGTADGPGVK